MTWRPIARKDVADAVRSRSLWALGAVFLVLFVGLAVAVPWLGRGTFEDFLGLAVEVVGVVVPLVALVLGYKAVIGERSTGSVALLLSLPHSRWDALVGKFLGRSVVLTVPVAVAAGVAGLVALLLLGGVDVLDYLVFVVAGVLLGLAYLGIAVGLSASSTDQRRVSAAAFGAFVLLGPFWENVVTLLVLLLFRFQGVVLAAPPDWAVLLEFASPSTAYAYLAAALLGVGDAGSVSAASARWFVEPWVAVLILLAWVAVPLAAGYWRFAASDLTT